MSNELSPFEKWIAAKGHDPKTIAIEVRKKMGDEYISEMKKGRDHTKIVNK